MFTDKLASSRLLIEADLQPIQGTRFQPTGFPDLGSASYRGPGGDAMLLVESVQSMANRMEDVSWDKTKDDWISALDGLSYVKVFRPDGGFLTASPLEAHRLNSPYIMEAKLPDEKKFVDVVKSRLDSVTSTLPSMRDVAALVAEYDINALIHGVFFAQKALFGGRLRIPRMLSGFVEARDVAVAMSGGVKLDDVDPSGSAEAGKGHVPFSRQEYTARKITAYFNMDLTQVHGFGLSPTVSDLILAVSLLKIRALLVRGLRFRTACDLQLVELRVAQPAEFELPELAVLEEIVPDLVDKAMSEGAFSTSAVTRLTYDKTTKES